MKKRLLSMLLVFVMLLSVLPVGALAGDDGKGNSYNWMVATISPKSSGTGYNISAASGDVNTISNVKVYTSIALLN